MASLSTTELIEARAVYKQPHIKRTSLAQFGSETLRKICEESNLTVTGTGKRAGMRVLKDDYLNAIYLQRGMSPKPRRGKAS